MRKIKGLRWYMIGLVTLGTVLGYLTRNTIAVAAPTLQTELHITTQQYSYIVAAYSACYTVMQPVAGYVLDLLGTKVGYAVCDLLRRDGAGGKLGRSGPGARRSGCRRSRDDPCRAKSQ
jgi:ACS family hexuronate transporter-like MFS transporter